MLYDYCESSDTNVHTCLYRDDVDATHASLGKTIYDITDKMIETMEERIA